MGKHSAKTKKSKTKLGLPDLDHSKGAALESVRSPDPKRGYLGCKQRIRGAVNDRIGIEPWPNFECVAD